MSQLISTRLRWVRQDDPHGCGVACVAMAAGVTYAQARATFQGLGLEAHPRRKSKPFSSNFREVCAALARHGRQGVVKRWTGWEAFSGIGIVKVVSAGWRPGRGWHWVIAEEHPTYGFVLLDPLMDLPGFKNPPLHVEYRSMEILVPCGSWIQVLSPAQPTPVAAQLPCDGQLELALSPS